MTEKIEIQQQFHPIRIAIKTWFVLVLLFLGIFPSLFAQSDNLEPESGVFSSLGSDSYYVKIKKVLFDSLQYSPDARVLVMPSFTPEYLITIDTKSNQTFLTYRIANEQIWYNRNKVLPECKKYKINIDSSLTTKIKKLFSLAILKVKYQENPILMEDGTMYVFMVNAGSGQTHSPEGKKMLGLIEITSWLVDSAKNGGIFHQHEMSIRLSELIELFKKE